MAAGLLFVSACSTDTDDTDGGSGGNDKASATSNNDDPGEKVVIGGTLLSGGRGTIVGTVLGVLIFTTLSNVFTQNNLSSSVQSVAKGLIIVGAVLLQQRLAARSNSGT
jgi:ABC-type xylose transport system permease subunit